MKDEYLWEKTGDDAEIKRIEDVLSVYRYRETAPPAVIVPVGRSWIRTWRFPFAVAGFAVVLLIVGIGFNVPIGSEGDDVTFIYHPSATQEAPQTVEPEIPESQPRPASPGPRIRREIDPTTVSMPRPRTTRTQKNRTVVLTKQERDAYQQVLLALSISSAKINIVRDTINGVDKKDDGPEVNNR
jgi:hypothetical protein